MKISRRFVPDEIAYCVYKGDVINITFIPSGYRVKYFEYTNGKYIAVICKDRRVILKILCMLCAIMLIINCYNAIFRRVNVVVPDTMIYKDSLLAMNVLNDSEHNISIKLSCDEFEYAFVLSSGESVGTIDIGYNLSDIRSLLLSINVVDSLSMQYNKIIWLEPLNK